MFIHGILVLTKLNTGQPGPPPLFKISQTFIIIYEHWIVAEWRPPNQEYYWGVTSPLWLSGDMNWNHFDPQHGLGAESAHSDPCRSSSPGSRFWWVSLVHYPYRSRNYFELFSFHSKFLEGHHSEPVDSYALRKGAAGGYWKRSRTSFLFLVWGTCHMRFRIWAGLWRLSQTHQKLMNFGVRMEWAERNYSVVSSHFLSDSFSGDRARLRQGIQGLQPQILRLRITRRRQFHSFQSICAVSLEWLDLQRPDLLKPRIFHSTIFANNSFCAISYAFIPVLPQIFNRI